MHAPAHTIPLQGRPGLTRLDLMLAIQGARAAGFNHYAHALEQMLRREIKPTRQAAPQRALRNK